MEAPSSRRTTLVICAVVVLGVAAFGAIASLQRASSQSRDAQLALAGIKQDLDELRGAPFLILDDPELDPELPARNMERLERRINARVEALRRESPAPGLSSVSPRLRTSVAVLDQILAYGVSLRTPPPGQDQPVPLFGPRPGLRVLIVSLDGAQRPVVSALREARSDYGRRADQAELRALFGAGFAISSLIVAFALIFRSAVRARAAAESLSRENERLLQTSRTEALSDVLTGLPNRRALATDLAAKLDTPGAREPFLLALFDLDGFKQYNDTFGHPAGDELLARLGKRLLAAVDDRGTAYRMGGDEFCILCPAARGNDERVPEAAAAALSERGEAFEIGCSYGVASLPGEASSGAEALQLADQRLYERKASRAAASRQSADVLLRVINERNPSLGEHISSVAEMAVATARRLDLPEHEVKRIGLGAELHDVGKAAIPDAILEKPAPLDEREWAFMRRHTEIGARIVAAAPALEHVADLVRASHERVDGTGYPDGLSGDAIPLGASVIAVCDAYEAMVNRRPYREALSRDDALEELRRHAGTQFDARVVEQFCDMLERDAAAGTRLSPV